MTAGKRIALNVAATYGRSLLDAACGLFASRWVLQALGAEAYGVFGVVGAVVALVSLVNGVLSAGVGRYLAFSHGAAAASNDPAHSLESCTRWFNVAVAVHVTFAAVCTTIGFVVGWWGVESYFSIPAALCPTAHWVLRFALASVFVSVVGAPFRALFVAQQKIAELTVLETVVPLLNVAFAGWLLVYDGDRLFFNAFYLMLFSVLSAAVVALRAFCVFPACRIDFRMMWDPFRVRQLMSFAGWQFVGWVGLTCRTQGVAVIVNRVLGLASNSTISVSGTVSAKAASLSNALTGAFAPAVANAAGAGDRKGAYGLALRSCKMGAVLCALFAIPLLVEMDYVVGLWLVTVPPHLPGMCRCLLVALLFDKMADGAWAAIMAEGRIKVHEICNAALFACTLAVAGLLVVYTPLGVVGVGLAFAANSALMMVLKMSLWKLQLKFPVGQWFRFAAGFASASGLAFCAGWAVRSALPASFGRLALSGSVSLAVLAAGALFAGVLDAEERRLLRQRLADCVRKG